jgi:ubiquinone/menaquinone biosynthesis C-methylase UbiE
MGLVRFPAWPARYTGRAAEIRREEGLLSLSSRILHKLVGSVVDWGGITFFERTLDVECSLPQPAITVREVRAPEVAALKDGLDPTQPLEEITCRFQRGDRAFAAVDGDGAGVHTRWLTTSRAYIPEIDREIVLGRHQAYFYNGYTRPDRRRRGIDGLVRSLIFATLRPEGITAVYSYVRRDNPVGLRAAARWQRPVGTVWYVRIGRSRRFVFGARQSAFPALIRTGRSEPTDAGRERAWRRWFESWPGEPLSKRSTGCSSLPEPYFQSAASFIASALQLTPADDVLDVGCDSAMISRLIAPGCRRFTGLDFIPEMLRDARDLAMARGTRTNNRFIAGDARLLPIRSGTFGKVYCSAVIHTLPTTADGLAVIDELIRVTARGGTVLVSSVPDRAKRFANRLQIWRRASWLEKVTLPCRWAVPRSVRQLARRLLAIPSGGPPGFLDYDLRAIARALQARGLTCTIRDFPADYWNRDFRTTRSNLLITIPQPERRGVTG